ncbi:NAD(P)/FAD-dependent oxidoreductase [Microbacterium sp. LWH7-1.2]|uniref:flavin-containing monooxygenase n=1 Tax=Microbacterium sp. LWH7-1.2 TaxID=3135257 RepID=UPI003138E795
MTIAAPLEKSAASNDPGDVLADWLEALENALRGGSTEALARLFLPDATWRDFLAFEWDHSNRIGREALVERLAEWSTKWHASGFVPDEGQAPVVIDGAVNAFFRFRTDERSNRAFVVLVQSDEGYAAAVLQTQLDALERFPERSRHHRRDGKVYEVVPGRTRWADDRAKESSFTDSEPVVVVIGGGHNGLAQAARLTALGVPTLVIEKNERIGDNWRKRYSALALHSPIFADDQPYIPFPDTWTAHTPKDKLADWMESYAKLLDLNVWTGTEFLDADYDEDAQRWNLRTRLADGSFRELHPRHVVITTGLNGPPRIPEVRGLDTFTGEWAHTGEYQHASRWAGKRAIVIGAGVSAHELAQDLWEQGADVTMLQRSSTYVISLEATFKYMYGLYTQDKIWTKDYTDQVAFSLPNRSPAALAGLQNIVAAAAEHDRELLDGLTANGFKLEWGPDKTGVIGLHMSGKDGYQFDLGGSRLIAEGKIKVKQGVELVEVDGETLIFSDGSRDRADLILFATGYVQFWDYLKTRFGKAAEKIDRIYVPTDDQGEYPNAWRRSAQPGLWFGPGFVQSSSFFSKWPAFLIKAIEEGIIPRDPDASA